MAAEFWYSYWHKLFLVLSMSWGTEVVQHAICVKLLSVSSSAASRRRCGYHVFIILKLVFLGNFSLLTSSFCFPGNDERPVCKLCSAEGFGDLRRPQPWADSFACQGPPERTEEIHLRETYCCPGGEAYSRRRYQIPKPLLVILTATHFSSLLICVVMEAYCLLLPYLHIFANPFSFGLHLFFSFAERRIGVSSQSCRDWMVSLTE